LHLLPFGTDAEIHSSCSSVVEIVVSLGLGYNLGTSSCWITLDWVSGEFIVGLYGMNGHIQASTTWMRIHDGWLHWQFYLICKRKKTGRGRNRWMVSEFFVRFSSST
jgi:hypothetical protein